MDEKVSLNYRYSGAWREISTRINARQNVITIYVALVLPVLGLCLTNPEHSRLLLTIPAITVICTLLVKMHEEMIGNLANYCKCCEMIGNKDNKLPSYHVKDDPWSKRTPEIRKSHDNVLQFLFNSPVFVAFLLFFKANFEWFTDLKFEPIFLGSLYFIGTMIFTFLKLLSISKLRTNLHEEECSHVKNQNNA